MKTVYLAGGSTRNANGNSVGWREHVKQLLNCPTIAPSNDYGAAELAEFIAIVKKGRRDIDACDILLANYMKPTSETSMEVLYAWERGLIVVLVATPNNELSPWVLYHQHKLCFSLEDATSYINSRLLSASQSMGPSESFIHGSKMITQRDQCNA